MLFRLLDDRKKMDYYVTCFTDLIILLPSNTITCKIKLYKRLQRKERVWKNRKFNIKEGGL